MNHFKRGFSLVLSLLFLSAFMACQKPEVVERKALCPVDGLSTYTPKEEGSTEFVRNDAYLGFGEQVALAGTEVAGKYGKLELVFEKITRENGMVVWVNQKYLVPDGAIGVLVSDDVLLYSEPDITKNTSMFLSRGQLVGVFPEKKNGFTQISGWSDKDKGFARVYVKDETVSVNEKDITVIILRNKALAEKNPKVRLEILKSADEQASPAFGNDIRELLAKASESAASQSSGSVSALPERASEEFKQNGVISSDNVRVRDYPYEEGTAVITTLSTGAEIEILARTVSAYTIGENSARWYKIASPEGWVFGAFVELK